MSEYLTQEELTVYPYNDTNEPVRKDDPKYLAWKKVNEPGAIEEMLNKLGVDPTKDPLTVMMGLQKVFAEKFHPVTNLSKDEIDHWVLAYDVCITDEVTEVHEHLSVFPGMDPKDNLYELKKEFIDIWHFLMDEFLVADMDVKRLLTVYDNKIGGNVLNSNNPMEAIFINERNKLNNAYNGQLSQLTGIELDSAIHIYSSLILAGMSAVRKQISWKHWKKPAAEINFDKLHEAFIDTFSALVKCFILTGLDSKELFDIYVVKNCENSYRQLYGY